MSYATVGVAWEVQLMACKFLSADGWGYVSGAVSCIDFAVVKGARVLSNSWGGGGHSQALYDAIAGRGMPACCLWPQPATAQRIPTASRIIPVAMIWTISFQWRRWIAGRHGKLV